MSYTHLTEQERYVISHLKVAKFSLREIARKINLDFLYLIELLKHF